MVIRLRPSKKREGKERGSERENWWLLISWVQSLRSFYLLWFLCTGSPVFFWKVSPFLETSWSWVPPTCGSDLVLDPPWLWCTCQTPKEAPICFSTIKSETFYSLLRIGFADHQMQFTSIPGQECPKFLPVCVWSSLIDSSTSPSIYAAWARPILLFPRS